MIDLRPYFNKLSLGELIEISDKYKISYPYEEKGFEYFQQFLYDTLSREQLYNELFKIERNIQIDTSSLQEITEEFELSDTSYQYLLDKVLSHNPRIRVNAIKALLLHYPDECENAIKETLLFEESLFVISNIRREIESTQNPEYLELLNKFLIKCSLMAYDLDIDDIKFLIDLNQSYSGFEEAYMHPDFGGIGSMPSLNDIDQNPTTINYEYLLNPTPGDEQAWISIDRGYITGLVIYDDLPDSIRLLKHLKFLGISNVNQSFEWSHNELEDLPSIIGEIKTLKHLSISYYDIGNLLEIIKSLPKLSSLKLDFISLESVPPKNREQLIKELTDHVQIRNLTLAKVDFDSIPQWIKNIAQAYHSHNYTKEGVIEKDAVVLGILEILLREKIQNYRITIQQRKNNYIKTYGIEYLPENNDEFFFEDPFYYKINDDGKVIEILIGELCGEHMINILPDELMDLEALEILNIKCRDLKVVPASIQEKFSIRPQHEDFQKALKDAESKKPPPTKMDIKIPVNHQDIESIREFTMDSFFKNNKILQDYARDMWDLQDDKSLTEKERRNREITRMKKFDEDYKQQKRKRKD